VFAHEARVSELAKAALNLEERRLLV
jgi:hypothetical protein